MPNYPVPYQNNWGYSGVGQQMYPAYQQQSMMQQPQQVSQAMAQGDHGLKWVDGEVGAKAYQMPSGWPPNTPIALWDTNDTVIYLKSINPMGMPNPLQKAHYKLENYQQVSPMKSGDEAPEKIMPVGVSEQNMYNSMHVYRLAKADGFPCVYISTDHTGRESVTRNVALLLSMVAKFCP